MRYWLYCCVLVLSGCANLSLNDVYQSPTFDYQQTSIRAVSLDDLDGRSTVRIQNSNPYRLPISRLKTELWLDGEPWLSLSNVALSGLPANDSIVADLDWTLVYGQLMSRAVSVYEAGEANLTLRMSPTLEVPVLGPRTLNWSAEFRVPIPKLPRIRLTDWSVASVTLTEIRLSLGVEVDNPNVFSIVTQGLGLSMVQDGRQLASVGLADSRIASSAKSRQQVDLSLSLLDVGFSLANALKTGQWPQSLVMNWQGDWASPDLNAALPKLPGGSLL